MKVVTLVQWQTVKDWSVGCVVEYRTRSAAAAVGNFKETLKAESRTMPFSISYQKSVSDLKISLIILVHDEL